MNDNDWIGMTDRARLMALFDTAAECNADVSLFERDEPDAPAALASWAAARNQQMHTQGGDVHYVAVTTKGHRSICVYLRVVEMKVAA